MQDSRGEEFSADDAVKSIQTPRCKAELVVTVTLADVWSATVVVAIQVRH